MEHAGSSFLKFWSCDEFATSRNDFKEKTRVPVDAAVLTGGSSLPVGACLFCLGNEHGCCAVSSTEVMP